TIGITGGADFSFNGSSLGVDFEKGGVQITGGKLSSLDVSVDSGLHLFGLTLTTTGLAPGYDQTTSEFSIFGSISLSSGDQKLNSKDARTDKIFNGVSATLGDETSPGLVIEDGSLKTLDVDVNGSVNFFGFTASVKDLKVKYDKVASAVYV